MTYAAFLYVIKAPWDCSGVPGDALYLGNVCGGARDLDKEPPVPKSIPAPWIMLKSQFVIYWNSCSVVIIGLSVFSFSSSERHNNASVCFLKISLMHRVLGRVGSEKGCLVSMEAFEASAKENIESDRLL